MKKILFITALIIGSLSAFPNAHAQSTGITMNMIDTAQNPAADYADVAPHSDKIRPDPRSSSVHCRSTPRINTGVRVYRWHAEEKRGEWIDYEDSFCLTQGCHYSYSTSTSNINPLTGEAEQDEEGNDREFEHVRAECVNTIPPEPETASPGVTRHPIVIP